MEPILEHLPLEGNESFLVKMFDLPFFDSPWHYHPQFELVLITKGEGKRFVGNAVSDFQEGDLTFIGSNLPHLFKNSIDYYDNCPELRAKSIVIQFLKDALGKDFWALPQSRKIHSLLDLSQQGIHIIGETKKKLIEKMNQIVHLEGMERLICLLEILNNLSNTTDYELISDTGIIGHNALDTQRLNIVFEYILLNYQKDIQLKDVADLICMTRTSFCRFFQERTRRSFSNFLIDFRLLQASKLLIETSQSIEQISYECGYNSLSNFNRQFKKKFSTTPFNHRKEHCKSVASDKELGNE